VADDIDSPPLGPKVNAGSGEASEHWTLTSSADGSVTYRLSAWAYFFDFLEAELFQSTAKRLYIWRGQSKSAWSLSSSLDRLFMKVDLFEKKSLSQLDDLSKEHLRAFKHASRGRRGVNPQSLADNDWWALGQHYGLATPLLDWTRSPFAAAYFAFQEDVSEPTEYRVVYGLDQNAVLQRNKDIIDGPSLEKGGPPILDLIDPMSDENYRLVSQGGLFTRTPIGTPVEQWVANAFEGSANSVLLRIEIPDRDRMVCLKALNRMNINHLSLFPDLVGASRHSNLNMELSPE
jgi:hypothetical protein